MYVRSYVRTYICKSQYVRRIQLNIFRLVKHLMYIRMYSTLRRTFHNYDNIAIDLPLTKAYHVVTVP